MGVSGKNRWLAVWALCLGMLLNALTCSYHHATHIGLELLLGTGAFCLTDDNSQPSAQADPTSAGDAMASLPFNCPLCSPVSLDLLFLACLGWLLLRRCPAALHLPREQRCRPPPRHCWPPLNPRAP